MSSLRLTPPAARLLPHALALGLLIGAMPAAAQMTPAAFMAACQSSPDNLVILRQSLKLQGSFTGETYTASSGCSVYLSNDAALELDTLTLRFGGPFTIVGADKGKLVAAKAVLEASTIEVRFLREEGQLEINEGQLYARDGDFNANFAGKGRLEMKNSGGWTRGGIRARGAVRFATGDFFTGTVSDSGIEGGAGIRFDIFGRDTEWKVEKSTLNVSNFTFAGAAPVTTGPFAIQSSAFKSKVEISDTNLRFASQTIDVRLAGAESSLLLNGVTSQTGSQSIYLGAPGDKGVVLIERPLFLGNPEIVVQSGPSGATGVIGNPGSLTAQRRVSVSSGPGGSCVVTPSWTLTAPQVEACR
ncbi:MAG: hypothetical protein ACRC2H_11575 [Silanimonas sp.]